MLQGRLGHLHTARAANGRVGDVAVAADLVGGVDDHHPLAVRQHPRRLAQQGGLAHAWLAQQQDALARLDDVLQDVDHPVDGAADPHRQADDAALAVADAGDAVQGALDAGPVVAGELADALDHEVQVLLADLALAQGASRRR